MSNAALVFSGRNKKHRKAKWMNQHITPWKPKQALRWCGYIYLLAGLCILRSCCWNWVLGVNSFPLEKRFRITHLSSTSYWLVREIFSVYVAENKEGNFNLLACHCIQLFQFKEQGEISNPPEVFMKYLSHSMSVAAVAWECTNPDQSSSPTMLSAGAWVFPYRSHYCCAWEAYLRLLAKQQVRISVAQLLLLSTERDIGANHISRGLNRPLWVLIPSINYNWWMGETN